MMMRRFPIIRDKTFYKNVLTIMVPIMLQQIINQGVNMMDTLMLGALGETQLSASSLANSYYNLFSILCLGIIAGCTVLASQYWGAGNIRKVKESFSLAIQLTVILSLVFTVLTALFPSTIMSIYSKESDVIRYGVLYLRITVFIFLIHGLSMVTAFMFRSIHNAKLGFFVSLISFAVNIGANWVFIFGKFGMPRMEIAGAALGTLIARCVELLVVVIYVFGIEKKLKLRPGDLFHLPERELLYNYRKLGLAALFSDGLLVFGGNVTNIIIGRMGSAIVSANAVCQVIDRLCISVTGSSSEAASIITGNTIGEGKIDRAKTQGYTFYIIGIFLGLLNSILVFMIGTFSIRFYSLAPATILLAHKLMRIYAVLVLFQTIQSIMTKGVLRGGGDTRFLLVADVLFLWILCIPLGYVSGLVLGLPAWVTILFLRIDNVIKSFWCLGRLRSGKWIRRTEKI